MRFLLVPADQNSPLIPQVAGRDWWSIAVNNEPLPNEMARVVLVDALLPRDHTRAWLAKKSEGINVFIMDLGASARDITNWLDMGAMDVIEKIDGAVDLVEDFVSNISATNKQVRLVGRSRQMEAIREKIRLVAARKCSVLIEGETGTGKEVVARLIHMGSDRHQQPWITVNCAAIPEPLLEAELFGHVKGAFTGAVQGRIGKFEAANRGTIFLDEIGDMPFSVQSKLLRVLQEKEIERLGGNDRVHLDVRVIAATNARLEEAVRQGKFRQDLYYRLNVIRIEIPPLRERPSDVTFLARRFMQRTCEAESLPHKHLSEDALYALCAHSWPGNVRELENCMEAAVILSEHRRTLTAQDFELETFDKRSQPDSPEYCLPKHGIEYQRAIEDFERTLITQALGRVRGNKTAAAELLGMKRTTLAAKLKTLENRLPRLVA